MPQGVVPFTATIGTTAKTCIQLLATGGLQVEVRGFAITAAGTSPTATPLLAEILRQTTAGTGAAATPNLWDGDSTAVVATAIDTYTVEPTAGDILFRVYGTPQGGVGWEWVNADGPRGVTNGRIAVRVTGDASTSGLTCAGFIRFNEL